VSSQWNCADRAGGVLPRWLLSLVEHDLHSMFLWIILSLVERGACAVRKWKLLPGKLSIAKIMSSRGVVWLTFCRADFVWRGHILGNDQCH